MRGSASFQVTLSYKLQKLLTGEALKSAARHARRGYPRMPLAHEADRIMRTVQAEKFRQIRKRHAVPNPGNAWPKYLDLERWMTINLQRVRDAGLDLSRGKRILDLGCGTGYFLYICQFFGHDVLGLDMDGTPGFAEMMALFALPRLIWEIAPFVPLPDLGGKFDFITAHMICFNGHKSERLWGVSEWDFFLDDLALHLNPRGSIWLELNREHDGNHYTPELRSFFQSRGAEVHTQRVLFHRLRPTPGVSTRARGIPTFLRPSPTARHLHLPPITH